MIIPFNNIYQEYVTIYHDLLQSLDCKITYDINSNIYHRFVNYNGSKNFLEMLRFLETYCIIVQSHISKLNLSVKKIQNTIYISLQNLRKRPLTHLFFFHPPFFPKFDRIQMQFQSI